MEDKKFCKRCSTLKDNTNFTKDKSRKSGLYPICKSCKNIIARIYRNNNKDKAKYYYERTKDSRKKHKSEYGKEYRSKKSTKEKIAKYNEENKDKIKKYNKEYYEKSKEKQSLYGKERRKNRTEEEKIKEREYQREYKKKNKKEIKEKRRKLSNKRYNEDPLFRLQINLRGLMYKSFRDKNYTKRSKTSEMVGLLYPDLKEYLDNNPYGFRTEDEGIDIDHIIPLNTAKTEEELIKLNHHTNLQLLPSYYNRIIKKDSVFDIEDFENWLNKNKQG